jgi:outer membrane protein OmpA-like peptidoglycan-associated protein
MLRAPVRASALLFALVLAPAAVVCPRTACAQGKPGGALDQLDPAPPGDSFFSLPSADVRGRLRLSAQLLGSYAREPLVLRYVSGAASLAWVRDQALLHAQVSLQVARLFEVDLDMPATVAAGGVSGTLGTTSVTAPSGAAAGDLRAGVRFALLPQRGLVPGAALGLTVWAPVGSHTAFSGAGVIRAQPGISLGAEYTHLVWGASVGARFQPAADAAIGGSRVVGGAGVAGRVLGFTVGPELHYQVETGDVRATVVRQSSRVSAELLLGARYALGPMHFGLAGGPGLGSGPGTPRYRLIAAVTGTFDLLPLEEPGGAGAGDGGAGRGRGGVTPVAEPPLDTDGDGVPDAEDACPTQVGDASPGAYRRGCPPDRDRDGIPDADDACPEVPGLPSDDPKKNGCPADTDGDGIPDDKDACPREAGPASADPKQNGCPTAVRVEGTQIIILEQVNFETGRDEIKPDSFALLQQVTDVLRQHPEIARVAVDGHTDDRGGDKPNKNLSERRALAVVRWMVEHGVDARRLEARGFGQRRPLADNKTDAGRAKNRRVEFQIRKRTDQGEAGWVDGPIEPVVQGPK